MCVYVCDNLKHPLSEVVETSGTHPTFFDRNFKKKINHATSSNLYRFYYPHWSRELVSPVCGIFFNDFSAFFGIWSQQTVDNGPGELARVGSPHPKKKTLEILDFFREKISYPFFLEKLLM